MTPNNCYHWGLRFNYTEGIGTAARSSAEDQPGSFKIGLAHPRLTACSEICTCFAETINCSSQDRIFTVPELASESATTLTLAHNPGLTLVAEGMINATLLPRLRTLDLTNSPVQFFSPKILASFTAGLSLIGAGSINNTAVDSPTDPGFTLVCCQKLTLPHVNALSSDGRILGTLSTCDLPESTSSPCPSCVLEPGASPQTANPWRSNRPQ